VIRLEPLAYRRKEHEMQDQGKKIIK